MLTVIQALPALNAGGVERGTLEVAAELIRRGHRSIVVSDEGDLLKDLLAQGSEHYLLPVGKKSPLTFRHVYGLRKIISDTRATILHARSRLPAWLAYMAWKNLPPASRPGFITSVHGQYSVNAYSRIMTQGERVIAISEFIKDYIIENYPDTPPERIQVIPRGVDRTQYRHGFQPGNIWLRDWENQYPHLINKTLITLPGRITRRKGHEDFLEIMTRLLTQYPQIHGLIVGGPHPQKQSYFKTLIKKIRVAGLQEHITFTGQRQDLREIISISKIVMSLSVEPEAFGRTTLEALSLGVPVIAYDHGGSSEILNTVFPAGLVKKHDVAAAARLIACFLETKPLVPDENPYTLQKMLDGTINLYQSLADSSIAHN